MFCLQQFVTTCSTGCALVPPPLTRHATLAPPLNPSRLHAGRRSSPLTPCRMHAQHLLEPHDIPLSTNRHYNAPPAATICPDMDACRAKINALAPVDAEIYTTARTHFEAVLAAQGPSFGGRLSALRAARAAHLLRFGQISQPAEPYHRFLAGPAARGVDVNFSRVRCSLGCSEPARVVCKQVRVVSESLSPRSGPGLAPKAHPDPPSSPTCRAPPSLAAGHLGNSEQESLAAHQQRLLRPPPSVRNAGHQGGTMQEVAAAGDGQKRSRRHRRHVRASLQPSTRRLTPAGRECDRPAVPLPGRKHRWRAAASQPAPLGRQRRASNRSSTGGDRALTHGMAIQR